MNPLFAKILPYLVGAAAIVVGILWFADHERGVEREKIAAQNYQVLADAKAKANKETIRLQGVANAADKDAKTAKTDFDAYRAAHPVGHVWVCKPASSSQHSPSDKPQADTGNAGPGTGPQIGSDVLAGSPSTATDVGPELDTILQGFARLAIELQRWQHQPIAQ